MTIFNEIVKQHAKSDKIFQKEASKARSDRSLENIMAARDRNDQAYFLFLFSRLEAEINLAADKLINSRCTGKLWTQNRAWIVLKDREPPLMSKCRTASKERWRRVERY